MWAGWWESWAASTAARWVAVRAGSKAAGSGFPLAGLWAGARVVARAAKWAVQRDGGTAGWRADRWAEARVAN